MWVGITPWLPGFNFSGATSLPVSAKPLHSHSTPVNFFIMLYSLGDRSPQVNNLFFFLFFLILPPKVQWGWDGDLVNFSTVPTINVKHRCEARLFGYENCWEAKKHVHTKLNFFFLQLFIQFDFS